MCEIFDKITKNEDWMGYMEIVKKDRCYSQNKYLQLVLNFYTKISEKLKKLNNIQIKIDKYLTQLLKIFERPNLINKKKLI
jgi:hypothetical protein